MGLVTNALKSVGKEFLANKAADILDVSKKDTPVENTQQNDIPVDASDLISIEDIYEPTVSDASENDPGIVELENYELEPIEDLEDKRNNLEDFYNTWGDWDMFKQNLKSQQDYEQPLLDVDDNDPVTVDSNDSPTIPDTDNTPEIINQESTQDSTLPQESAPQVGNTTISESSAPLSVPETNINVDKQAEGTIENNPTIAEQATEDVSGEGSSMEMVRKGLKEAVDEGDTEEVENIIEEYPEESQEVLPEDTPIQEEAKQITEDTIPQNDEVNNEVVKDFVEESAGNDQFKDIENKPYYDDWVNSEPGSEQFKNAYVSVVNDYGKEEADKQLKAWGIELPKEVNEETGIDDFEAYARKAGEEAGDRKQLEKEHAKAFEEKLRHNNQQAWKDYALEKSKLNTRGSIRKGFENEVGKSILAEIMTPEEWMNDSLREGVLRHTTYTKDPVEVRKRLRESIAEEKKALGIDEETLRAKEEAKRQEESKRKEEEKKRRDEAWAKLMADDKGKSNKKAGSSFINVPEDTEPLSLVSGYKREGDKLLDEYGNEIPDYEPIDTEGGISAERDEDFLGPDEWVDEEGNIHDYSELANGNTEALDKKWYEGDDSGEGEYSESGNVNLDYEAAELQDQIEEAEALPVTNAEEAKEKQNKLRALRLKLKEVQTSTGSGSNVSSASPTTDNGTQTTGGRVSPRAGIGSIGGGASGHGSMASTRPTKTVGDSHNSIASKAPLPHALEDNQGRVVSVNGKATTAPSSNNNGAFRSGSFGLMSKAKAKSDLKSIPSKAPVSSGAEHMGSPMAGTSGDLNLEDGKQVLIERLKQLLAQFTDEEKKQMGFSPALNQWNGKALTKLDGYTLQDLIDKVEEHLGEMNNGMAQ